MTSTVDPATGTGTATAAETDPLEILAPRRPKRADARRNYEKVIAAAREAFAEGGSATSLEAIARRAGVGIGTLYRNFPNRQALLEALYFGEVEELCRSTADLGGLAPFDALRAWVTRFATYLTTKLALVDELLEYVDRDSERFWATRVTIRGASEPLLERAQAAGAVRDDVTLDDVMRMVTGIVKVSAAEPEMQERLLGIALDGLRRPAG